MAPSTPRLRILSVGGNAVSAFLSWRLQATNACDVTLVWKAGFETVAQYGISFKSARFGTERFKPRQVVRTPEDAAQIPSKGSYDYVLLCVKALPDVYDLASVIEPVVTPQHTCILINTSHSLGVEASIEKRFPKNVVLSLVSHAEINQLGPSEFEHIGSSDLWVGPANLNAEIPVSIQSDMAEALAMTLGSGQIECKVSKNIQQQQFERMVGPIAFHTTSVLFETPNHAELLGLPGVRSLISDTIGEVISIAQARGCSFPQNFKETTMEQMILPQDAHSIMYQDYAARRPMEIETYLGAPMKIAGEVRVHVPRIETLYALLHHVNIANQRRAALPAQADLPPTPSPFPARVSSGPPPRAFPNGQGRPSFNGYGMPPQGRGGSRAPSMNGPPPAMYRRGPPPPGYGPNGMIPPRGPGQMQRRPSFEHGSGLDEFSHVVMYDQQGSDSFQDGSASIYGDGPATSQLAIRERELMLRQKEIALRERELHMRGNGRLPGPPRPHPAQFDDDDEDGEDYFDPMAYRGPPVNPDNVDMMSITSRRTRKQPSVSQIRQNPEGSGPRRGNPYGRPGMNRNRASSARGSEVGLVHENIEDNPLFGYTDNRYGMVSRNDLGRESRTNSLTAARLDELQQGNGHGGYPPPMNRRTSQSPGNPFGPAARGPPRPATNGGGGGGGYPPNGNHSNGLPPTPNGMVPNGNSPFGGPSPPSDMRQPMPRHAPGHGNAVAPQGIEQRAGVSNLYPPKSATQVRSLTGSASASAGSGDSAGSGQIESEDSAHSSQISLGPRPAIGVR